MSRNDEDSNTRLSRLIDYTTLVIISLLVVFTPVVVLAITMSFLLFSEGLELAELSTLELVELYLIELGVFVVFGYLLYRVTLSSIEKHLPEVLDRLEGDDERRETTSRGPGSPPPGSERDDSDRR